MGWFTSSATTVEGCQRIASACAPKASALKQCVAINGERACEGLASDYELCRATRMKACEDIADAFEKCGRKNVHWNGLPEDAPDCARELKAMRKCVRKNWRTA